MLFHARSTIDIILMRMQLVEKYKEMLTRMQMIFINLEKTHNSIPTKMTEMIMLR